MIICKKCEGFAHSHTWNEVSDHLKELHENSVILPDGTEVSNPELEGIHERIEELEKNQCGMHVGTIDVEMRKLKERLEKLEETEKDVTNNTQTELLKLYRRIEKLEADRDVANSVTFPFMQQRLENLERPEREHIKENRKNIVDVAPQLLELGNHDIELRERIEKLEASHTQSGPVMYSHIADKVKMLEDKMQGLMEKE